MEVAIGEGRGSFNMEEGMARRDLDPSFKELIEKDRVFTCEKHFVAEDTEISKYKFYNSFDLRFCLQFDFALFTVWPFYHGLLLS